ncbi:MAG: acyl-CoA dehydrogenase family protein [bacterium]
MERDLFNEDHQMFRDMFTKFLQREVEPYYDKWEKEGMVDPELWKKAGENGFLCPWLPEEYGGSGVDFLYSAVMIESLAGMGFSGFGVNLHNDIAVPYIWTFGNEGQKKKWLPGCCTGEYITAVAMTEPDAGSDLQAIRTTAVKDGNEYVINGQKTFITNGILNNLCIVAAKTDPKADPPYKGVSLFLVEGETPGYNKGRNLEKIGMHSQDTAELLFDDCRVPAENLLGEEGQGFISLMKELQQERLVCAIGSAAAIWRTLALTKDYINERKAFGRPLSRFQNTRFKMAEMYTIAEITQTFVDQLVKRHVAGEKIDVETAMAKYWVTENLKKTVDECLQFFGGYGYMEEYPIARYYRDVRVQTIFAGTTEIMKEIISRDRLA